jgi:hypothetical protein
MRAVKTLSTSSASTSLKGETDVAKTDDYQYRGKALTFCTWEELIECIIGQHREIRTTRKTRDNYLDEVIALRRALEEEKHKNDELRERLYERVDMCA